ncbi:MAG: hypothetical protein HQ477_05205 [Chloroflexi bacterium]|nr:hypothetical protein [Chloroflexota bacterium]
MRGDLNTNRVRLLGTTMPLLFVALFFAVLVSSCSSSSEDSNERTPTVSVTASDPAALTPTVIATTTVGDSPTPIPPTTVPAATKVPLATTAAAVPTATSAPPTPTPFPLGGDFFLNLVEPVELDIFATTSTLNVVGQTRVDAVVTVNDDIVIPNTEGIFEHTVSLEVGINIIEVVGSVSADEQASYVITVVYLP